MELKQEIMAVVNALPEATLPKVLEYVHQVERETKAPVKLRLLDHLPSILVKHDNLFKRLA